MSIKNSHIGKGTLIYQPELVNIYNADIGENCKIGAFVEIGAAVIGDECNIQAYAFIPGGIVIARNVFIGPRVTFCNDKYPPSNGEHWRSTVVQSEASIGAGAIILPGIVIGRGARIAAGAVITKNVPNGELVYGANHRKD